MSLRRAAEKRLSSAQAAATLVAWSAAGRVAVAVGAFDLLDIAAVRALNAARAGADRLAVVVRGDVEVMASLGAGRPLLAAEDRAGLVAALRTVDLVTIASDPAAYARVTEAAGSATWVDVDAARATAPDAVARVRRAHADG